MMIKMQVIGNVGQDPKVSENDRGKIVSFSVAALKSKQSDQDEPTIWINVIATGRMAETAEQYIKKGSQVFVDGQLARNTKNDSITIFLSDMKFLASPRPKNPNYKSNYSKPTKKEDSEEAPF